MSIDPSLSRVQFKQNMADRYGVITFRGTIGNFSVIFSTTGITIWNHDAERAVRQVDWTHVL